MKYGNRSRWKKIVGSPITLVVVVMLLLFLAKGNWNLYKKTEVSAARLTQARLELDTLKDREQVIAGKVQKLSTPEGIEAEIRTKFHGVKAGESVAVIIDDEQSASAKSAFDMATSTLGWWGRLMRKVGVGN